MSTPLLQRRAALRLIAAGASPPTARAQAQEQKGGTLRSVVVGDPPGLGVHVLLPSLYESVWLVYDRPIAYDDIQPLSFGGFGYTDAWIAQ
jgi:hypothetical protein